MNTDAPMISELVKYRGLLGMLAWRDIRVRYKQSLLGVAWAFLMPLVLREGMACGLPALSTRLLGLHETVSPGTGTLVAPDDPTELAQAMSDMIDLPPEQHRAMAAAARAKAEAEFSLLHEVSTIVGWMADER